MQYRIITIGYSLGRGAPGYGWPFFTFCFGASTAKDGIQMDRQHAGCARCVTLVVMPVDLIASMTLYIIVRFLQVYRIIHNGAKKP